MVIARASLLPLFALPGLFNPAHTTAVADLLDATPPSSSLSSAFHLLNITVRGRLHTSVPFEKACSSILEGQSVNVSAAACAALQANYTNPLYRVDHFGAYMNTQWETCQSSKVTDGCLLDSSNVSNPLAFEGVNCRLGNVPPYYINVRSATDVQAALAFSNSTGVRLSVKNKGHDSKGRSGGRSTLSLLTTELRNTSHNAQFRPAGCSENTTYNAITTGAGVLTQNVYEFANSVNRTIIGGYHQTVGFSGRYLLMRPSFLTWSRVQLSSSCSHRTFVLIDTCGMILVDKTTPLNHSVAISPDGSLRVLCCARAKDGTVFFRRMCGLLPAD